MIRLQKKANCIGNIYSSLVQCPKPPVPQEVRYRPRRKQYIYQDDVDVRCRGNLALLTKSSIQCTQHGNWSEIPVCGVCE